MSNLSKSDAWSKTNPTAALVLSDGTALLGAGFGMTGKTSGEVCFNTAITGYEEIITDPSYAGQIITFTFPHIGNVGTNEEDFESLNETNFSAARGIVVRTEITDPSNFRAANNLDAWLKEKNIIGISNIDTRALTTLIRKNGMQNATLVHEPSGKFDISALAAEAKEVPSLVGMDLAKTVTLPKQLEWNESSWKINRGYTEHKNAEFHVVAIDYGIKRNILRLLADVGCKITVVSAKTPSAKILALNPDGFFLSNGPGDPDATGSYAVQIIKELVATNLPLFGICLGHQLLALAVGCNTIKMHQGHHGANHPIRDNKTGKVEITSMNHGFAVDKTTLPANVIETHTSLFDNSNCGIRLQNKPVFSVQFHPEASPGPQDCHYLFKLFKDEMQAKKQLN